MIKVVAEVVIAEVILVVVAAVFVELGVSSSFLSSSSSFMLMLPIRTGWYFDSNYSCTDYPCNQRLWYFGTRYT